jgi:hypothetical protein
VLKFVSYSLSAQVGQFFLFVLKLTSYSLSDQVSQFFS